MNEEILRLIFADRAAIFGLLGVIIGSGITWVREYLREEKMRKRSARYLAVRIMCVLEEYVERCCDVASDDGTEDGQPAGMTDGGEQYRIIQTEHPAFPAYPDDVDWKSISHVLMHQILSLPIAAKRVHATILADLEHEIFPRKRFFDLRRERYAQLGLDVIALQEALRKEGDIPHEDLKIAPDYDCKEHLESTVAELKNRRSKP